MIDERDALNGIQNGEENGVTTSVGPRGALRTYDL